MEETVNRATDVVGDSLLERFTVVKNANREAGRQLDGVAKGLQGRPVDFNPAVQSFIDDLGNMGIRLGDDLKPNFKGSDIEGVKGAERAVSNIVKRMRENATPDAFEVHRLKKFIDEQVTFGKSKKGLSGKTEAVLKRLRRNLDQTLDQNFPEYNAVNTTFAETKQAIDALQAIAGKKVNLSGPNSDKVLGTLMRRIASNAQSRVPLLEAAEGLEAIAKRFSDKIDGDLVTQVRFADELDSVFGPTASASFHGDIAKGIRKGVDAASGRGGIADLVIDAGVGAAKKVRGKNEENAFKAIEALLSP